MSTYRDLAIRALKTAVQTTLAIVVASGTGYIDADVWKAAAIAAGAAALSATQNGLTALWGASQSDATGD
jgi:hypothetical protein